MFNKVNDKQNNGPKKYATIYIFPIDFPINKVKLMDLKNIIPVVNFFTSRYYCFHSVIKLMFPVAFPKKATGKKISHFIFFYQYIFLCCL